MPATERQGRTRVALELAVSEDELAGEPQHEVALSLLPMPPYQHFDPEDDSQGEWLAGDDVLDDVLLEASDVVEAEVARAEIAGIAAVEILDERGADGDDEQLPEPLVEAPIQDLDSEDDREPEFADLDPGDTLEGEIEAEAEFEFEAEFELHLDTESPIEFELELESAALPEVAAEPANSDPIRVPRWSGVNTLGYAFSRGLRGMGQSPLVQLLAIGTMAVCMLLLGTTMLIFQNAQRVVSDLGIDTPVTVYMLPDADPAAAEALRERIADLPEVEGAERVTPEMALARLQDGLGQSSDLSKGHNGERSSLLAGIDPSNLPDSIEIKLVAGVEAGFGDALAARVQEMDGVEEVAALGPWAQKVEHMLTTLRWLAFGVGGLVSLACLAIVWSTIRLGVFARRSEIEILRLVGGTPRFVRGPFVVEGVLQGVLGTALALAGLWLCFELIQPFLERGMSLMFAAGSLHFFTIVEVGVALAFGALLGVIGSRAAVSRYAEA